MKKCLLVILVGMFCLGAANVSAKEGRKPRETRREKMINLEVENQLLKERIASLEQENKELKEGKSANPYEQILHDQISRYTSFSEGKGVKPYYANAEVQAKCESILICSAWAREQYKKSLNSATPFKIEEARIEMYELDRRARLYLVYRQADGNLLERPIYLQSTWLGHMAPFTGLVGVECVLPYNYRDEGGTMDIKATRERGGFDRYY